MEYQRPVREKRPVPTNQQLGLRPGTYSYNRSKTWTYYPDVFRKRRAEGVASAKLKCVVGADCKVVVSVSAMDYAMGVSAFRTFETDAILDGFVLPDAITFGRATDLVAECVTAFIAECASCL